MSAAEGNVWVGDVNYMSDTARFMSATKIGVRRGSNVVDPALNPGNSYLILRPAAVDRESNIYYLPVPELPIINAYGKNIKYPIVMARVYYKVNKRWLIAWYPIDKSAGLFNPSAYIFSIWKKKLERALISKVTQTINSEMGVDT